MPGGGSKPGERRGPGRAGVPNKDKVAFRAMVQESVLLHTQMLRDKAEKKLRTDAKTKNLPQEEINRLLDLMQPVIEEYDPVVELALVASDYGNPVKIRLDANGQAARYLRPQLKTIEHLEDPATIASMEKKQELADRLTQGILAAMQGKSSAAPPPGQPEGPKGDDEEDF